MNIFKKDKPRDSVKDSEKAIKEKAKYDMKDFIGKDVVIQLGKYSFCLNNVTQYKVIDVTPSGCCVLLKDIFGNYSWLNVFDIKLVEDLKGVTKLIRRKPEIEESGNE